MSDREAQVTIESGDRPNEVPQEDAPNGSPFARRIFTLRNIISIFLTLVVLYLMYRELLGLDWRQAWTSLQQANAGLFALGFAVFYCSFPVRALRWKTLLANVGYELTAVPYMPSTFGLCRIMYLTWSANCITIARLGDAYRTYLLKRAVGVSFVVTLGTVVAERLLDMFVLAMMMGAALLFAFHEALPSGAAEVFAAGLIFTAVGVLGLLWMRRLRGAVERLLPKRLHSHYARLEQCELQIYEVPVHWIEDLNNRVEVLPTAIKGVKRLLRVWRGRLRHRFSKRQSREVLNADRHGRLASANSAISLVHESDVLYSSLVRVGPSTNDSSTKKLDPASERDGFGSRGRGQDLLTCEPDSKTEQPGYGQVGATAHLRALIWTGVEEIDANVHYPVDAISNCHEERNQINNTSVTSSIDCQHRC